MTTTEQSKMGVGHTPGPWVATRTDPAEGYDCWWITACPLPNQEKEVATVSGGYPHDRHEANARLIAAAPTMLAALETAGWLLTDLSPDGLVLKQIKAAVALAKGEAVEAWATEAPAPGVLEALEALEGYLRATPHHNAPEAAAARKAISLARSDDALAKGEGA